MRPQAVPCRATVRARAGRWGGALAIVLLVLVALRPALAAGEDTSAAGPEVAVIADWSSADDRAATPKLAAAQPSGAPEPAPRPPPPQPAAAAPARSRFGSKLALAVYEQAAARYGVSPALLQALHAVESSAAMDGCLANLEGSGAVGPFQFMPSTFRAYGVDANADGRTDACNVVDALFSAARYLRALGADADPASAATRRALKRYGTDVERVVTLARGA